MAAVEYRHMNKIKWSVADSSLCKMIAGQAWDPSFVTRTGVIPAQDRQRQVDHKFLVTENTVSDGKVDGTPGATLRVDFWPLHMFAHKHT